MEIKEYRFPGVYSDGTDIYTKNLAPGNKVYGEKLVHTGGVEYRAWNPKRSKLGAMLLRGTQHFPFGNDTNVLYLGAASGTTASHISDICIDGRIFCIEFAPRSFRDLITVCESRENMMPILADASHPSEYSAEVGEVDVVYMDIAQRDQSSIFSKNVKKYCKNGGYGIMAIKARSIDVTERPEKIFSNVKSELSREFEVVEMLDLEPFEKDHASIVVRA